MGLETESYMQSNVRSWALPSRYYSTRSQSPLEMRIASRASLGVLHLRIGTLVTACAFWSH